MGPPMLPPDGLGLSAETAGAPLRQVCHKAV